MGKLLDRWSGLQTILLTEKNFWQQDIDQKLIVKWGVMALFKVVMVALLFYDYIWVAIIISPYIYWDVRTQYLKYLEDKKSRLAMEFKDGMLSVSFSLNVGYSIENSFKEAVKDLEMIYGDKGEMVLVFKDIVRHISRNENVEEVLLSYARTTGVPDIIYFAEIFQYAKRSGGDLIAIIKNSAATMREKLEIDQEIQTIISGKKMEQKVMAIMPFGMIGYMRLTSPEFVEALYGNILGIGIMTVCLIVYLLADYLAKRIVKINV